MNISKKLWNIIRNYIEFSIHISQIILFQFFLCPKIIFLFIIYIIKGHLVFEYHYFIIIEFWVSKFLVIMFWVAFCTIPSHKSVQLITWYIVNALTFCEQTQHTFTHLIHLAFTYIKSKDREKGKGGKWNQTHKS